MAERLAPERAPEQSLSRPEPQRGGRRRWPAWLALGTAGVLVLGAITVLVGHLLLVDRSARGVRASALVPDGQPARVLVVLARPGQEVGLAGTLEALDRAGATVSVLSLTRGEAQAPLVGESAGARGDLRAEGFDFRRAYERSAVFRDLAQPERYGGACGQCAFRGECGGCRARAYAATGDYLAAEPGCPLTQSVS